MAEYTKGHQKGENGAGNRNNLTRKGYADVYNGYIMSSINEETRRKEYNKKYGNGKYINEGIIARVYGEYLIDLSELSKLDKNSFEYGYYEAANTQIEIMIRDNKISDFIKDSLNKKTKFAKEEKMGLYIKEILYQIGYRDSYDNNFDINKLSEIIKNNEDYVDGFEQGLHEQYSKGR